MGTVTGLAGMVLVLLLLPPAAALSMSIESGSEWTGKTAFVVTVDRAPATATFTVTQGTATVVAATVFSPDLVPCGPNYCFSFGARLPHISAPVECATVEDPQQCVEGGYTYTIRLSAGGENAEAVVTVDLSQPSCTMGSAPAFAKNPASLSWSGTDTVSGIQQFIIERSSDGVTFQQLGTVPGTSAALDLPEGQNVVRCRAQDRAGNRGPASAPAELTVDTSPPVISFHHLPVWTSARAKQFVPPRAVNVSWNGTDTAGISCFTLQWSDNNGTFENVRKGGSECLTGTHEVFGNSLSENEPELVEGRTYHFRLFARDVLETPQSVYSYTFTTLDTILPEAALTARIGSEVVGPVRKSSETAGVAVEAAGTDSGSGLRSLTIRSRGFPGVGPFDDVLCALSAPCSQTFSLLPVGEKELEVVALAKDVAGNVRQSAAFLVLRNPLVRLPGPVSLFLGVEQKVDLSVRNPTGQEETVVLEICGSRGICPFYYQVEVAGAPAGAVIAPNRKRVTLTLPPYSATGLTLLVRPLETSDGTEQANRLLVFAHATDPQLDDVDSMVVTVDFPPEFPDLSWWAVGLLISGSLVVFWKRGTTER